MDCSHIPEKDYAAFGKLLLQKIGQNRVPVAGSLEVTERCNLRCVHCYINLAAKDRNARKRELSLPGIHNILDQIADEGCIWLLLTGGEPFIRSDFLDIYSYAKKKGFLITLFTNGTTITRRIADHLADWPPLSIEITLYGRTRETYERISGVRGSYERCLRGIALLNERRLPFKLKTMAMTLNKHELGDMKTYAEDLGAGFRFDAVLNPRLGGKRTPIRYRLSPEEIVELDVTDEKRAKEWHALVERCKESPLQPQYIYSCGAGARTFHVDAYGQLSACMLARTPSYDLQEGTFRQGWHSFLHESRYQRWSRDNTCQGCELRILCGQCPGHAQLESGDQEERVPFLCQIGRMRAKTFVPGYQGFQGDQNGRERDQA